MHVKSSTSDMSTNKHRPLNMYHRAASQSHHHNSVQPNFILSRVQWLCLSLSLLSLTVNVAVVIDFHLYNNCISILVSSACYVLNSSSNYTRRGGAISTETELI